MSDSSLGNAPAASQDFHDTTSQHDPGPAESAAEAAAIMGLSADNIATGATAPNSADASAGVGDNTSSTGASGLSSVAAPIVDQAKQQAQKVVEHTQRRAGEALDQARDKTKSWVEMQLDAAADNLDNVVGAVRDTGQQLRNHDPNNLGQAADVVSSAADSLQNVSTRLRDATTDEIITETQTFARHQPGIFLGGAFVVGFMLARFLKSSNPSGSADNNASRISPSTDRLLPVRIAPQSGTGG